MKEVKDVLNALKQAENPVEKINELWAEFNEKELKIENYNSKIEELKSIDLATSFNELTDDEIHRLEVCFSIDTAAAAWRKKLNWDIKSQERGYVISYSDKTVGFFIWRTDSPEKLKFPTEKIAVAFIEAIGEKELMQYFGI